MPIKIVTINDLDSNQKNVVEMTPYDSSMFVSGPPGSGKTSVAILRTRMLIDNGITNALFLLYNHSLYGYLNKIFTKMKLKSSIKIQTKDKFFWSMYYGLGGNNDDIRFLPYEKKYSMVLDTISRADLTRLHKYNLLVLDESQDFSDAELNILKRFADKMVVLADFDQQVYGRTIDASCFSNLQHKNLKTIYRFGKDIAHIAQPFSTSGVNLEQMVTKTGRTPAYKVITSFNKEVDVICEIIKNKMFADGTMAIISPTRDALLKLSEKLTAKHVDHFFSQNDNTSLRDYDFDSKRPLLVTAESSKGMEFDTVIMYHFDYPIYGDANKLIYLSLTRTCGELYVIDSGNLYPALRNLDGLKDMNEGEADGINEF